MRFRDRHRTQQRSPDINLIPMLDVLMTVLTFFIVVSMMLGVERGIEVPLPNQSQADLAQPDPLIAQFNPKGITLADQPLTQAELMQQIKTYLAQTPKGTVVLQAAPEVSYEQVVALLGVMKEVGGDRVLLAIE